MTLERTYGAIARLKSAWELVAAARREGTPAEEVLARLETDHGAKRRWASGAYQLRCCGIAASCTWSNEKGLLEHWYRNASLRLIKGESR